MIEIQEVEFRGQKKEKLTVTFCPVSLVNSSKPRKDTTAPKSTTNNPKYLCGTSQTLGNRPLGPVLFKGRRSTAWSEPRPIKDKSTIPKILWIFPEV